MKLNEARSTLDAVHKATAAQEAAQAAAEALHPWPPDARLVPSSHPSYPPAPPQILHPDIAKLGSYLFSLPGGIGSPTNADDHSMLKEIFCAGPVGRGDPVGCGTQANAGQTNVSGASVNPKDSLQHHGQGHANEPLQGESHLQGDHQGQLPFPSTRQADGQEPTEQQQVKDLTGWQRRLQTSVTAQQVHTGKLHSFVRAL